MGLRDSVTDYSKGDGLRFFWAMFRRRERCRSKLGRDILTFFLSRSAHRHGGYIGNGAKIAAVPSLPHGLHGVYISRYASVGKGCRIYQNVTIGEVGGKAPRIGDGCFIGAGAQIVGDIDIGKNVKVGAGAVVFTDVPDGATVVAQAPRIIIKDKGK